MADPDSRAGVRYVDPALLAFVERVHTGHDPALARAFDAPAAEGMPQIQVSPSEGKLLGLFLRMIRARKVVEVGTLAGYSAIHIARALPEDGKLYTVEYEPKHAEVARANIEAAGLSQRVEVRVGAGNEVLPSSPRAARSTRCSSTPTNRATPSMRRGRAQPAKGRAPARRQQLLLRQAARRRRQRARDAPLSRRASGRVRQRLRADSGWFGRRYQTLEAQTREVVGESCRRPLDKTAVGSAPAVSRLTGSLRTFQTPLTERRCPCTFGLDRRRPPGKAATTLGNFQVSEPTRTIRRLAIVNRGEAAMRCIRTVKSLRASEGSDLRVVALYTGGRSRRAVRAPRRPRDPAQAASDAGGELPRPRPPAARR